MPTLKGRTHWFDAKKPRIISVTREDARKAICSDHQNCVIAKAIKRICNPEWVDVGANTVLIKPWGTKRYIRYRLGKKAREQVRFFDKEGNFAPCFVELGVPCPSLQLGVSKIYQDNWKHRKIDPEKNRIRRAMHLRVKKPSR